MNSQWQAFLQSRSAEVSGQGIVSFPGAPREADCALCDLSALGLMAVTGAEAGSFLQGQLTNDVRALSEDRSHLSAHCSAKGRVLALFRAWRLDETYFLQLPRPLLAATRARLQLFVLRARVKLAEVSDEIVTLGLSGACAPALLQACLGPPPASPNRLTRYGDLVVLGVPGDRPRFLLLGPPEFMQEIWESLASQATPVNADFWSLLDIRAGIPSVYPETRELFIPQMLNLDLAQIDGVSFSKGCYTGQEIVARMHYLGKLKRRLYLGEVESDTAPAPGDRLHVSDRRSEQAGGWVVEVVHLGQHRYALLVVAERDAATAGEVRLGEPGPRVRLEAPPYGFPE